MLCCAVWCRDLFPLCRTSNSLAPHWHAGPKNAPCADQGTLRCDREGDRGGIRSHHRRLEPFPSPVRLSVRLFDRLTD